VRLLQRTTRRVALTEEGRRYMERCEEVIEKLAEAEAEIGQPNDLSGTVRLTVPIDMSKQRLAEVLGAFTDRHPSIRIEVIVTDETLDLVANNVDLALRGGCAWSRRAGGAKVRRRQPCVSRQPAVRRHSAAGAEAFPSCGARDLRPGASATEAIWREEANQTDRDA
jgi:DNA-binding transcriptional LysR family regulator